MVLPNGRRFKACPRLASLSSRGRFFGVFSVVFGRPSDSWQQHFLLVTSEVEKREQIPAARCSIETSLTKSDFQEVVEGDQLERNTNCILTNLFQVFNTDVMKRMISLLRLTCLVSLADVPNRMK